MEELKELVKTSNAELKAELLQQFALLQQADVEAKGRQEDDRSTLVSMYDTVSKQMVEVKQQLEGVLISRGDSTNELLLRVLGEVQELKVQQQQQQQQQVDSRTAQAAQHAMAAAANVVAAVQQQRELAGEMQATMGAAAAALSAAHQQGVIKEAVVGAANEAASAAVEQAVGGKEGTAGRAGVQQQQTTTAPSFQQLLDTAKVDDEEDVTSGMRNNAIRAAAYAIRRDMAADDMAQYIRDRFDSVYGKYWQCVVVQGGVSGKSTWHEEGPIRMVVGGWTVYLWKSDAASFDD